MVLNITSLDQVQHCNKLNWSLEKVQCFWDKVNIPDNHNECWKWQECKHNFEYGRFHFTGNTDGRLAHRLMYSLYNGRFPNELVIRHKCDNPSCVNPSHLLIGTKKDNARDMVERGRSSFGERNGNSKLTTIQVKEILNHLVADDFNQADLARKYNISNSTIQNISQGQRWARVFDLLTEEEKNKIRKNANIIGEKNCNAKLTTIQVKEILDLLVIGDYTQIQISVFYNVEPPNISNIARGNLWVEVYNTLSEVEKDKLNYNLRHPKNIKLTKKDVLKIRELYSQGIIQADLIKRFNMSKTAISNVIHRRTWKNI